MYLYDSKSFYNTFSLLQNPYKCHLRRRQVTWINAPEAGPKLER